MARVWEAGRFKVCLRGTGPAVGRWVLGPGKNPRSWPEPWTEGRGWGTTKAPVISGLSPTAPWAGPPPPPPASQS